MRQLEPGDLADNMPERVRPFIAVGRRVGRAADPDAIEHEKERAHR